MLYLENFDKDKKISLIGQGCMGIGGEFSEDASNYQEHLKALKIGIDLGMNLIDTAEVYAAGNSEKIIGEAIKGKRDEIYLATKVSPENHKFVDLVKSAENSLKRLSTDYLDLYQIHWPNPSVPIEETLKAMIKLLDSGKVRNIGICNFSIREIKEAEKFLGKYKFLSNQVEYNLFDRHIEDSLLPYGRSKNLLTIAYSPLDKGKTQDSNENNILNKLSKKYNKTPSQIALNWIINQELVVAIPKSTNPKHIVENASCLDFKITDSDYDLISKLCSNKPEKINPNQILVSVEGEGNRKVYQTIEEAIDNKLNLSPSPMELAEFIKLGEQIKPVRLKRCENKENYKYYLIEGRLRYWAWVIAFNGKRDIPAYIRF